MTIQTFTHLELLARDWQRDLDTALEFIDAAEKDRRNVPAHIRAEVAKAKGATRAYFAAFGA